MKTIRVLLIFSAVMLGFAASAEAQRTRRPTTKRPAVKPTPTPRPVVTIDVRLAREKVSNQRSNVTRFVDVLAPIAASIETFDRESKTKRFSQKSIDANTANKKKVTDAIRNLRTGLVNLENEFRAKLSLRKYLPQIQGIADLSAQSEDAAFAGRFTDSRKPLLAVAAKLSDTLAVMP